MANKQVITLIMKTIFMVIVLLGSTVSAQSLSSKVIQKAEIIRTITKAAGQVGVDSNLIIAICMTESSLRPVAPRMDGGTPSYGICQVKLETALEIDKVYKHKYLATPARLQSHYINAFYACKYLKLLLKQYNGHLEAAIDSYNKGHYVSSNSQYVRKVKRALEKASRRPLKRL